MNACNACGALVPDDDAFDEADGYCAICDADRETPEQRAERMRVEAEQANLRG